MDKPNGNYVDPDGDHVWVKNNAYHRLDGPAIIFGDGSRVHWRRHGEIHRTDGPAIMYHDGECRWFLYDTRYTFDRWLLANTDISEEQKVMLKLQYG